MNYFKVIKSCYCLYIRYDFGTLIIIHFWFNRHSKDPYSNCVPKSWVRDCCQTPFIKIQHFQQEREILQIVGRTRDEWVMVTTENEGGARHHWFLQRSTFYKGDPVFSELRLLVTKSYYVLSSKVNKQKESESTIQILTWILSYTRDSKVLMPPFIFTVTQKNCTR